MAMDGENQGGGEGAPAAQQQSWTVALPDELRGFAELKGWKGPDAVVESYRNLEKLRGVPAERLMKLPDRDDAPEWGDVWNRLGRPEKPEGYGIEADPDLLMAAHAAGLSKRQVAALATAIQQRGEAYNTRSEEEYSQSAEQADLNLKSEWGVEYENNLKVAGALAQRVREGLGISGDAWEGIVDKLNRSMGVENAVKMFAMLGRGTGEAAFVEGGEREFGFGMTPHAAQAAFDAFRSDPDKMNRYLNGDRGALAEFERLSELAAQGRPMGGPPR